MASKMSNQAAKQPKSVSPAKSSPGNVLKAPKMGLTDAKKHSTAHAIKKTQY